MLGIDHRSHVPIEEAHSELMETEHMTDFPSQFPGLPRASEVTRLLNMISSLILLTIKTLRKYLEQTEVG